MFGTALGFGAFVMIVLTVTQLVFRVMRVTLTEWVGDTVPLVRNMHVSSIISMVLDAGAGAHRHVGLPLADVRRLEPADGGALSLLVVTVWLKSEKRNPSYALYPMLFMYFTTLFATLRDGAQPLRHDRGEPEHERAAGGGRVGDDRGRRAAGRRRARSSGGTGSRPTERYRRRNRR